MAPPLMHGPPRPPASPCSFLCAVLSQDASCCGLEPSHVLDSKAPKSPLPQVLGHVAPSHFKALNWLGFKESCFSVAMDCVASGALAGGTRV